MTTVNTNEIHKDINLILPWYLNGTLKPEELAKVENHISICSECKSEIERLRLIQLSIIESSEAITVPEKQMEDDIMRRIDLYESSIKSPADFSLWAKVNQLIESFHIPNFSPALAMTLVVIQLAVIGILSGKLYTQDQKITTLSGNNSTIKYGGPRFIVVFNSSASEGEIRKLLTQFNAKIIDGPKANRFYILQLEEKPEAEITTEKILEELKNKTDVIEFVEPAFSQAQKE